ncbi:MAG: hypothetical protein WD844_00380 [Thermoleophilaceae bacterium]
MAEDLEIRAEPEPERTERVRFCSRCGALHDPGRNEPPGRSRVCVTCGMGVYLECTRDALGSLGTFFLVVTEELAIGAVSEGAEGIFGEEGGLVGSPLAALLTSPLGEDRLARTVRAAALGVRERVAVPIEASSESARGFGPLEARVSPCGPPRAALVAIEPAL